MKALLSLLTLLLLPSAASAHKPEIKTVDEVIQKATDAMGGLERIHAIHSLVFRGFHFEGSYKQEFEGSRTSSAVMTRMRPDMRLVGCRPEIPACDGKWGTIIESFDGQQGWELNWPRQRLVHTVNKAEQALHCGAEFDPLFIDYRQRGFHAQYLGQKTVLGKTGEAVQVDQEGCSSATYFFDPKSYELIMAELTIPIHARGESIPTVAVYKAFKVVDGVRIPSRSEEVNLNTGDVIGGADWTSIEANTITDPKIFAAPATAPTGMTAVVLRMLQLSGTVSAQEMMASYVMYRARGIASDEERQDEMNWLGFELLKQDKYDHAMAVFRQLLDENPDSASMYESIGEAYLQEDDKNNAIDAFQHAIDLGLKNDDVAKKLARLRSQ